MDNEEREELLRTRDWAPDERAAAHEPAAGPKDRARQEFQQQSKEFNARVHRAFAEIPVPPGLRDQILARSKVIPGGFWKQPRQLWGLAALLALLAFGLAFWSPIPREDRTIAGFRSRMVGFALREYRMDIHTNELAAVQSFLAQNGAPSRFTLPGGLASAPVKGGAKLSWQGQPVGMVCFAGARGETLYMFVIESALAAQTSAQPEIAPHKTLTTATWAADGTTFLLAAPLPQPAVEHLVKS